MHRLLAILLLFLLFNVHANDTYREIEWTELMPEDDLAILLNPPDIIASLEEGSDGDSLAGASEQLQDSLEAKRYFSALQSTRVVEVFNGAKVNIPGFVVPLDFDEQQQVTEFLLVPFFGACIHLPPPPPNQIIHVKYATGLSFMQIDAPYILEGTLHTTQVESPLAIAAYSMTVDSMVRYEG